MANTFKSIQATVNASAADAYTVPALTTTVVIGMRFGNNSLTDDIWVTARLNKSSTKTNVLGEHTPIPAGSALDGVMGTKLVMEAGDKLEIEGSGAACAELTLSVMEIS
jgi:hypothetical protein